MSKTPAEATILVVDDDENNLLIASSLLQLFGVPSAQVYTAEADPLEIMEQKLIGKLDLMFLDLQLPEKDGYEILKEIRAHAHFSDLHVVAMTANVMLKDINRMQAEGFDGFVAKPINGRLFGDWLVQFLQGEKLWTPV